MDRSELARSYRDISDEELMRMSSSGGLTPLAQDVADSELRSRGIDPRALKPAEPEPPPEIASGFETVFRTMDWNQAQAFKARLDAEGIPMYIGDAHTNQTDPLLTPALGGYRIRVPLEAAAEAKEIIAALVAGKFAIDE